MALLIINANEVVTVAGDRPKIKEQMSDIQVLKNVAILVDGEVIKAIDTIENLVQQFPDLVKNAEIIDAKGQIVLPGFIDCHTHLVHGGTRENEFQMRLNGSTYMEIMNAGGGIHATTKRTQDATFDGLYDKALYNLDRFLLHGVTTVEAKSGYGLNWETEQKQLLVAKKLHEQHKVDVVSTFMGAHAVPKEYKGNEDTFVDLIIHEMLPKVSEYQLAEFNDVFCEHGVFTPEQSRKILLAGKSLGLTPKIHADEIEPYDGAELAAEVGAISAEHLLVASNKGIEEMARAGTIGVLLPGTAFFLRAPFARGRLMVDSGVPVALSTDFNPGSSPTINLQFIMNLACMNMGMKVEEVITATTLNAACAINRGSTIGSLEPGKQADIVLLNVENVQQMNYFYGMNHVHTVIKKGEVVVKGGVLQ